MTKEEMQLQDIISRCNGVIVNEDNAQLFIDDFLAFKEHWDITRNIVNYKYNYIIEIVAEAYCILEDYDNAFKIAKDGIEKIEKDYPEYAPKAKSHVYEILARCYAHRLDLDSATKCFRKRAYYDMFEFNKSYPRTDFYSFRDVTPYSLDDLRNLTVSLSPVSSFNDPVDTALFPWIDKILEDDKITEEERTYYKAMRKAYAGYRCRCFSSNGPLPSWSEGKKPPYDTIPTHLNTLMWAHYANYHRGFCVVYNIPSSVTRPDTHEKSYTTMTDIKYIPSLPFGNQFNVKEAFFTKSNRWEYEHEVRLLYYKADDTSEHPVISLKDNPRIIHTDGTPEYSLGSKEPQFPIKALYIGLRCSDDNQSKILDIMSSYPNVPVYKIKVSDTDIYSLDCELISRKNQSIVDETTKSSRSYSCLCRLLGWIKNIICK